MQNDTITQPPSAPQHDYGFTPTPPRRQKNEGWRSILSTVLILIAAPLIALFLTAFVFQSYEVDGPSMEPTLYNRDRLIVTKVGKSWARLTGGDYIPKRGDIIVFHKDGLFEFSDGDEKQLIKRVVALPGERVVVKNGVITVFNDEHPLGFRPDSEADYGEKIPPTRGDVDIIVPEGEVFVCGDNRTNSRDSRDFGPVSSDDIIGDLALRIFPLDEIESF